MAERSPCSPLPFSAERGTEQNWTGMAFFLLRSPLQALHVYFTKLHKYECTVYAMISPKSSSFKIQRDAVSRGSSDVLIIYNLRRQRDALSRFRDVSFESHHQHPLTAVPSKRWETSRHVCNQTFPACLCPPIYPLSHIAPRSQHIHCRVSGPQWSQTFWWEWQRQALFCPASKTFWFLLVTVPEKEKTSKISSKLFMLCCSEMQSTKIKQWFNIRHKINNASSTKTTAQRHTKTLTIIH